MDDMMKIHLLIDNERYPMTIRREDEQLYRDAAKQIDNKLNKYRSYYPDFSPARHWAMAALELAFENQRWFDLLRWGIATQTVNNYLNSELLYTEYSYTVNDIEDWQTFLPIPVSVIDINPEIAQNTGY